ncbi:MAG TPA: VWA domain-containing protein [Polyangiaceae bacterium]|nr:VWA domain-containing protein [Polyangiaceae bacterium]
MTDPFRETERGERARRWLVAAGPLPTIFVMCGLALAVMGLASRCSTPRLTGARATVADLSPVHAGISVAKKSVSSLTRLVADDQVDSDADGRARIRLDDGTTCIVDRNTHVSVGAAGGLTLSEGRIFVQSPSSAKSEVRVAGLTVHLSGASAGLESRGGEASVYAADAELSVQQGLEERKVASGESAHWAANKLEIAPERAFDDWTFGLAAPWAARGQPRRALGELWGASPAQSSAPLTLRAHAVNASVEREVARTRAESTYFNGGSSNVAGDFRFAIPPAAVVSRFAVERDGSVDEGVVALASRSDTARVSSFPLLEWAGEGWLRGSIPSIAAGQTVKVIVEYVEWLSPHTRDGRTLIEYRYPLVGDSEAPLIGEFSAHLEAGKSSPISLSASAGSTVSDTSVDLRRSDFRPAADWVVTIEEHGDAGRARLYHAPAADNDTDRSDSVLLRTELPVAQASDGVTLALVLDTSGSTEPSMLDTERTLVGAILAGLSARDRVIVLSADQNARAVGPNALGPLDAPRRQAIESALSTLSPGGATDLGRALEAAADALPSDTPSAMAIYIGDGWPTLGDATLEQVQARLARRLGGAPRIGAVAVGPLANCTLLAALARGTGPLFEVSDSADAARTAVNLISDALRPAVSGVEVDFGPLVERVYPRTPRAVALGDSFSAVGRARGELPKFVTLRWRDEKGAHEQVRAVDSIGTSAQDDVRRRWALARVEETVLRGQGRETATDVALRAGLLTPWTGWVVGESAYTPTPFATRILDLSANGEGVVGPTFATPGARLGTLSAPADLAETADPSMEAAVTAAAERVIAGASDSVRACRNSRVALRPELAGTLDVSVVVGDDGVAREAKVHGTTPAAEDAALDLCVSVVLRGLVYPSGFGVHLSVRRLLELPASAGELAAHRCSDVAALAMPLRRGVWQERLDRDPPAQVYQEAKRACELATWADRRALLELILQHITNGSERVNVARELEKNGDSDAALLIRREAVRRAETPQELSLIRLALLGDEHYPRKVFEDRYRAAASNEQRLAVVRKFLDLAPHDARLRGRLVALLEALGQSSVLSEEIRQIRLDPFADAALLADSAAALGRVGNELESSRAFGELSERAPHDPWVRGFLGDRLRAEGHFDDAVAAYSVLEDLVPDDAGATLRLAVAHAEAGRTDLAERLFTRVLETGGRGGTRELSELSGLLAQVYAANALAKPAAALASADADADALQRMARELPHEAGVPMVLTRGLSPSAVFSVELQRGPEAAREAHQPDVASDALGMYALRVEDLALASGPGAKLVLSRVRELVPARPTRVRIDTLLAAGENEAPQLVESEVELPPDGSKVVLAWRGSAWVPASL